MLWRTAASLHALNVALSSCVACPAASDQACLGAAVEDEEALQTRSLRFELLQKSLTRTSTGHDFPIRSDVPALASNSTEACDLCAAEQRWLFVISPGRTGSTSLLEMLNAIPGVYLAGENFGLMNYVQELYEKDDVQILMAGENFSTGSFWHKPISRHNVLCSLQSFVKTMIGEFDQSQTSIIGFKEIRHHTAEEMDFFREVFPCARFVINTRADTQALLSSQHQTFEEKKSESELQSITATLEDWQAAHHKEAFLLRLEDFTLERFNEMLEWLGVSKCRYTSLAEVNTVQGYYPGHGRAKISGRCSISM